MEVWHPRFGPVPEDDFTLKAFGVQETDIKDAPLPPPPAASWRRNLFWLPAGWIIAALLIGVRRGKAAGHAVR